MVAKEINKRAPVKSKLLGLCLSYSIFMIVYNFSGWYAANTAGVGSFVFDFEHNMPFLSWMIIPYMSSGLLFIGLFFLCSYQDELVLFIKRIIFITIISGLFFILFPLRFSFIKPEIYSPFLSFFYQFLSTWDTNYNQAPSLHISYACLFWSVIRQKLVGKWKIVAGIWLLIMSISTLTIYQHHFIDILAAIFLVCITLLLFPGTKKRNTTIGILYFILSLSFSLIALLIYQYINRYGLLILWISLTLFLVGIAYIQSNSRFLKQKDGTIHLINKLVYFPYIISYKIMRRFFCKNAKIPVIEIFPQILVGAMLKSGQVAEFNIDRRTIVIDLSAELEENSTIRKITTYYSCPILDLGSAKKEAIESILHMLSKIYAGLKPTEKVYIHCSMGYSRSIYIATLFMSEQLDINTEDAIRFVRQQYPNAIFPHYLLNIGLKQQKI